MSWWLWLGSAFGVGTFMCFLVFPLPPLPIQGSKGLSSIVSFHWTHCSVWQVLGLGWRAGLVAGLRVAQAWGRSLSTQTPFVTQALTSITSTVLTILNQQFLKILLSIFIRSCFVWKKSQTFLVKWCSTVHDFLKVTLLIEDYPTLLSVSARSSYKYNCIIKVPCLYMWLIHCAHVKDSHIYPCMMHTFFSRWKISKAGLASPNLQSWLACKQIH